MRLLKRGEAEDGGTIRVATDIDGQRQSVVAVLKQADYERAVQAHRDRAPVVLAGDLERTGQRWRLLNPQVEGVLRDDGHESGDPWIAMPPSGVSESTVESVALDWLASLGWTVLHSPDIAPDTPAAERADYGEVVLKGRLRSALAQLKPNRPDDALDDALRRLTRPAGATLEARNRDFHRMAVAGLDVEYPDTDGRVRGDRVRALDFDDPDNNDWLAVNQFTVVENKHERRPDLVLFVNGLPLAVIELKNPADENATIRSAFQQLQTYKAEIPSLFIFNAASSFRTDWRRASAR